MTDLVMEAEEAFGTFDEISPPSITKPSSTFASNNRYMVLKPASSITEPLTVHRVHPWADQSLPEVNTQAGETATMHTESTGKSQIRLKQVRKTNILRSGGQFYRSASQKDLQKRIQMPSRIGKAFGLDQEQLEEDFHTTNIRQGIEIARIHSKHHQWKTPYEVDAPRAIMLPRDHPNETSSSSSSTMKNDDPATVEARIWKGIEQLMADTFSSDEDSICVSDVLPKALVRAMSQRSMLSTISDRPDVHSVTSQSAREQLEELDMAQAALNSFMDMILPSTDANGFPDESSIPTLTTIKASDDNDDDDNDDDDDDDDDSNAEDYRYDEIALAEAALNNFMDVLLQEVEYDKSSNKKNARQKQSAMQLLDLFQWTVRVNIDAEERYRYIEQERAQQKASIENMRLQHEEIMQLKFQEEQELRKLQEEEDRLKIQLLEEEAQRRREETEEEEEIMAELEKQELALQQKMEELRAANRFKIGALVSVGITRMERMQMQMETPADRRRARRIDMTKDDSPSPPPSETLAQQPLGPEQSLVSNETSPWLSLDVVEMEASQRQIQEEEEVDELRAKIAEAERMLMEEQQDVESEASPMIKRKKRKKKLIPSESPTRSPASGKKALATEGPVNSPPIRRLPRQFSSATIPSLADTLENDKSDVEDDNNEGDNRITSWATMGANPIVMRSEAGEDDSIDPKNLPNLQAIRRTQFTSSSSSSNKYSKSSGEIDRRKLPEISSSSEFTSKSVPSYLPSTSNRHLFVTQPSESSLDPSTLPNLAAERTSYKSEMKKQKQQPTSVPFWAAIGGRPIVMSTSSESHHSSDEHGGERSVKSNLLPSSFHESDHIHGLSGSTESSTPSLVKKITPTRVTTTPVLQHRGEEHSGDDLPDLKSISEGSMSESSSTSHSSTSHSGSSSSSDSSDSTSSSSSDSTDDSSSSSPSAVPSNAPSMTPSYIVEERVEHAEGSRGPTLDYALVFSDSFVRTSSLLPNRSGSESETDDRKDFPRFSRAPSRRNVGILSEAGDVFTDDVSQYSLDKFHRSFEVTPDGTHRSDSKRSKQRSVEHEVDVGTGRRADLVRQLSQHTGVCTVEGAGDIHVGATVRFGRDMDSSDESSSSDSDNITLDSELQADEMRYDGFRRDVPELKKHVRRLSLGGCIRSSIKAMREKGRCVTTHWPCRDKKNAMRRRPKFEKKLSSRRCLLHTEEQTYDRSHVLSGTQSQRRQLQSLVGIDEDGFMVTYGASP